MIGKHAKFLQYELQWMVVVQYEIGLTELSTLALCLLVDQWRSNVGWNVQPYLGVKKH